MNKKANIGKLKLEKFTIAKLSDPMLIRGGSQEPSLLDHYTEVTNKTSCISTITVIGSTQTINQGPTRTTK